MDRGALQDDIGRLETALRAPSFDDRNSRIVHLQPQPGLSLLSTDMRLMRPATVETEVFPAVCLSIVLNGYATRGPGRFETGFQPGEVWVASTKDRISTRTVILPRAPVQTVELVVTPRWFDEVERHGSGDNSLNAMHAAISRSTMTQRYRLEARLCLLAKSVQSALQQGVLDSLYFESRALDMVAALADKLQTVEGAYRSGHRRSTHDLMMAIRDRIDGDPGAAYTILALATEFGISASKLKQDFSATFGVGIGRYMVERRLRFAHDLIESHDLSISEAAYRAGYAHPGNFTAAFKRNFGRPPSMAAPRRNCPIA